MITTIQQIIDERIPFLKEQINNANSPEVNSTLQLQIDAIRSVGDIEKIEPISCSIYIAVVYAARWRRYHFNGRMKQRKIMLQWWENYSRQSRTITAAYYLSSIAAVIIIILLLTIASGRVLPNYKAARDYRKESKTIEK